MPTKDRQSRRLREENPQDSAKLTDDADSSTGDPTKLIIEHPQHETTASIGLLDGSDSFDDGMRLFVSEALGRTIPCASTGNERRDERSA
jgi:hypothetical protein